MTIPGEVIKPERYSGLDSGLEELPCVNDLFAAGNVSVALLCG